MLRSQPEEARQLCDALGSDAIAFHLSGGGAAHDVAGEFIPHRLSASRNSNNAATLARASAIIGPARLRGVRARFDACLTAIATLDGLDFDEVVYLFGGEPPEVT
eukprot:639094-Prymnesium_polylepis.1